MNIQQQANDIEKQIAKLQSDYAKLKEEMSKPKNGRFVPEMDEPFFYIIAFGEVLNTIYENHPSDNFKLRIGNCYRTQEEAKKALLRINTIADVNEIIREENEKSGWVADVNDKNQAKGRLLYDRHNKSANIIIWTNFDYAEIFDSINPEKREQVISRITQEQIAIIWRL